MKDYIGTQMEFVVEDMGQFRAKLVADRRDMILVKGEKDSFARRIIKSKIISFMPLEKTDNDVNLLVLKCDNPTNRCPGIQYVMEGEGFSQKDFNVFMGACPMRCETCRTGSMGELRSIEGGELKKLIAGTLLGDYPEPQKTES